MNDGLEPWTWSFRAMILQHTVTYGAGVGTSGYFHQQWLGSENNAEQNGYAFMVYNQGGNISRKAKQYSNVSSLCCSANIRRSTNCLQYLSNLIFFIHLQSHPVRVKLIITNKSSAFPLPTFRPPPKTDTTPVEFHFTGYQLSSEFILKFGSYFQSPAWVSSFLQLRLDSVSYSFFVGSQVQPVTKQL